VNPARPSADWPRPWLRGAGTRPAASSAPRRASSAARARPCALVSVALAALLLLAGLCAALARPAGARVARPELQSKSAIVVDARFGDVLFAHRADDRRGIASATKLMTALLLLERARPSDVFTAARYRAAPVESQIGLRAGERMRVRDLLTALLLESANDAATTIAQNVSGSRAAFVRDMNRRARELGLNSTRYSNPIGLDAPGNRSSARDLGRLAVRLLHSPVVARTVARTRARLGSGARPRTVRNRNTLVGAYPFVVGVKTGHTLGAGYVLVGAGRGGGSEVVSVVLGAPSEAARNADTLALLRYGLDRFHRVRLARPGAPVATRPVDGRGGARVALASPSGVVATVRRDVRPALRVHAPTQIEGPLPRGRRVGVLEVRAGPRLIASAPLVTVAAVPAPSPLSFLTHPAVAATALTALAVLAIVSAVGLRRRRRGRRAATTVP
jgi:D-alanyl-D-alanine carboxypeptidase (penicillin-binding protein 5/6)